MGSALSEGFRRNLYIHVRQSQSRNLIDLLKHEIVPKYLF